MTERPYSQNFGGDWTEKKLEIMKRYLDSYCIALKDTNFKKAYIDAFAGTGYRSIEKKEDSPQLIIPELDTFYSEIPQDFLDGSAKIALRTEPGFDKYIFIEKNPKKCAELEKLKEEFKDKSNDIEIVNGEANEEIKMLCEKDWTRHRAVLFLDPYGLQVEWSTIESIAKTKAIDLWILFPVGIGVNRLLKKDGDIPYSWKNRLNLLLGSEKWEEEFYRKKKQMNLFGEEEETIDKIVDFDGIGNYFIDRLKTIFPGVAPNPKLLKNRSNNPIYMLCFAASNDVGASIAIRIAGHILDKI